MMKKILGLLLAALLLFGLCACSDIADQVADRVSDQASEQVDQMLESIFGEEGTAATTDRETTAPIAPTTEATEPDWIDENGWFYSKDDVALYLHTYGRLPDNFITKDEARALGWEGGSVEQYQTGAAIGGDKFGNREGILPKASGRQYYECDIDTDGMSSRGAKRIVYSNDGLIYYTDDHYETFTLLYGEE